MRLHCNVWCVYIAFFFILYFFGKAKFIIVQPTIAVNNLLSKFNNIPLDYMCQEWD